MQDKHLPTKVAEEQVGGARVGPYQRLSPHHALAFAMGMHARLGAAQTTLPEGGWGGGSRSGGALPEGSGTYCEKGCVYGSMPEDLVRRVLDACNSRPEGAGAKTEGVVRLLGGGRMPAKAPV